jgi:hypothetical protein
VNRSHFRRLAACLSHILFSIVLLPTAVSAEDLICEVTNETKLLGTIIVTTHTSTSRESIEWRLPSQQQDVILSLYLEKASDVGPNPNSLRAISVRWKVPSKPLPSTLSTVIEASNGLKLSVPQIAVGRPSTEFPYSELVAVLDLKEAVISNLERIVRGGGELNLSIYDGQKLLKYGKYEVPPKNMFNMSISSAEMKIKQHALPVCRRTTTSSTSTSSSPISLPPVRPPER